jgi:hypothetical protein
MADRPAEGKRFLLPGQAAIHTSKEVNDMATSKAEEVYTKTEALIAGGMNKADAFKHLAEEYGQPVNSIRGSYYSFTSGKGNGKSRPRRRETTPGDALADARASLERAIQAIDREVETAEERASEAAEEAKALKASASDRKKVITERLEALK